MRRPRAYYVLGDLAANITVGALAGLACHLIIDQTWHMLIAMFVMMPLGMLISLPASLPYLMFFGGPEVMLPTMLTGMTSAMVTGMYIADRALDPLSSALLGGVCGLGVIVFVWICNGLLLGIHQHGR